jgi:transcriptional regulator with XRE-family HTH domain
MTSITIEQIKAARGLLDWTQADLARETGLSLTALNNIERRIASPRQSTMDLIAKTLEQGGVEFTDGPGVKMRGEAFEFLEFKGRDFIDRQTQDLMQHIKSGDYVWMCNSDERKIRQFGAAADDTYQIFLRENKIDERIIVPHGHNYFVSHPKAYRWITPEVIGPILWMVYADRTAFFIWEKPMRCIVIRSQSLHDAYKKQFQFLWKQAKIPPPHITSAFKR